MTIEPIGNPRKSVGVPNVAFAHTIATSPAGPLTTAKSSMMDVQNELVRTNWSWYGEPAITCALGFLLP